MSTFPRSCGCCLNYHCETARALYAAAEEARREFGLAEYDRLMRVWVAHRIGRTGDGPTLLRCSVCGTEKAPEEFDRQNDRRRGYRSACRACERARREGVTSPAARDEYQVEEQPSTLALLEKSLQCRTVPPLGLREQSADESQSPDEMRAFPGPCTMAGCEGGILTLNRGLSLPCPRCGRREASK